MPDITSNQPRGNPAWYPLSLPYSWWGKWGSGNLTMYLGNIITIQGPEALTWNQFQSSSHWTWRWPFLVDIEMEECTYFIHQDHAWPSPPRDNHAVQCLTWPVPFLDWELCKRWGGVGYVHQFIPNTKLRACHVVTSSIHMSDEELNTELNKRIKTNQSSLVGVDLWGKETFWAQ